MTEPAGDSLAGGLANLPWRTIVDSENIGYSGIYRLVATHDSAGAVARAPFELTIDGVSLEPEDPGVHESDPDYSDRSIWPIPDSAAGPEGDAETPTDEPTEEDTDLDEGGPAPTTDVEANDPEATDTEQTSDDAATEPWARAAAVLGGIVLIRSAAYLLWRRRRA